MSRSPRPACPSSGSEPRRHTRCRGTATVMTNAAGLARFPFLPEGSASIALQTQLGTPLATGTATIIAAGTTAQRAFTVTLPTPQPPKSAVSAGWADHGAEPGDRHVHRVDGERPAHRCDARVRGDLWVGEHAVGGHRVLRDGLLHTDDRRRRTRLHPDDSGVPTRVGVVTVVVETTCDGVAEADDLGEIVMCRPVGTRHRCSLSDPVVGAEVYLYRVPGWSPRRSSADDGTPMTCQTNESKAPGAPWSQPAPIGDGVLEPSNSVRISPQVNPFVTDGVGYYGWDVAEGCS